MVHGGIGKAVINLLLWALGLRRLYRVTGDSMRPTLVEGDLLFVQAGLAKDSLETGDVVVALHPFRIGLILVKRVAEVMNDGRIALLGDNSHESSDSRQFGAVAPGQILGRATCRIAASRSTSTLKPNWV
jgi:nickel-type superoxide dismutase maturation protease